MPTSQTTQPSHNQLDTKAQAWSALFSEPMSDLVKRYTSSVFFDKRLWQADIAGSLAHAEMLAAQGIIEPINPGNTVYKAYRLTHKGTDLLPILQAMAEWGDKYPSTPSNLA